MFKRLPIKAFIKYFLKELLMGVIVGIAVVVATEYIEERKDLSNLRSSLQTIALGESEKYIESIYGVPIISCYSDNLLNAYYKLEDCVLRCVYDKENMLIAFILTVKSDKIYEIRNIWFIGEVYLGDFSYEEFSRDYDSIDFICNVPANNDDYAFYQEKYYGAGIVDYNYIIIGSYKDYSKKSLYNDFLSLYTLNGFDDVKFAASEEYASFRRKLHPNTFGMIMSGYENKIDLIDNVDEVRMYGDILYGDW